MSNRLFVRRPTHPDKVQGPFSVAQLRKFAKRGLLRRSDEVSSNGTDWFAAGAIEPPLPFGEAKPLRSASASPSVVSQPAAARPTPPRVSPLAAIYVEAKRLLNEGERTRAIGECRVGLDCDFDTAHGVIQQIEAGASLDDVIQSMEKVAGEQPTHEFVPAQPADKASKQTATKESATEESAMGNVLAVGCGIIMVLGFIGAALNAASMLSTEFSFPPQLVVVFICFALAIGWEMLTGSAK